jgi:hypothetical protein
MTSRSKSAAMGSFARGVGLAFLSLILSGLAARAVAQTAASAPCGDPEHRKLDFWLGDWDAFDRGGAAKTPSARVRVESVLDGCALRELYEGADGSAGQSLTTYDATRKNWHQTWVTNRGGLLQIDGRFEGSRLVMAGKQARAGREEMVRADWRPQDGGVRETAEISVDGGATWKPWFDILFRRHASPSTR